MPLFTFQLQPLLAHRQRVEDDARRQMTAVNDELLSAQADLRQVEQTVQLALTDLRENRLVGRIDLPFLSAHRRFMTAMQRQGSDRARRVATAQAKVDAARQQLAEAAKQRKAIETLRDQQHERWRQEQGRREAAAGDEVAMQMAVQLQADERDERLTEDGR